MASAVSVNMELQKDNDKKWELSIKLLKKMNLTNLLNFKHGWQRMDDLEDTEHDIILITFNAFQKYEKKTGKVRKIPFNLSIQTRIEELYILLKRPNPNELIFKSKFTGVSVSSQYLNRIMKEWKAKYKLDIENFSTHTFRKTFGRYVYDTSENKSEALLLLNRIFNHSNIEITKIYICIREDEINSIFDSIRL